MRYSIFLAALIALPASAASLTASLVDRAGAPLQDAVVYAVPVGAAAAAKAAPGTIEVATIAQQGRQFTPYVTVVHTGAQIRFPNYDKIEHHVKSFSAAKEFELKIYEAGTPPPVTFDKPGVVIVYCMLHDWMRGYVYIVDSPYFAKSDASGNATLPNLPEGNYEIKAWHPDFGAFKSPLVVSAKVPAADNAPVKFAFDLIPKKRRSAKD